MRFLLLGVLGFDVGVLAVSGLSPCRMPAADFTQAFRILTVAPVVTPRMVFCAGSFAQANPRARPGPLARRRRFPVTWPMPTGGLISQGKPGANVQPFASALSKLE